MLGSATEADGCHTKAEGGIFNGQAECLQQIWSIIYQSQNHPAKTFLKLRQAGLMTKPFPRIFSASNLLTLFHSIKISTNQPTNHSFKVSLFL